MSYSHLEHITAFSVLYGLAPFIVKLPIVMIPSNTGALDFLYALKDLQISQLMPISSPSLSKSISIVLDTAHIRFARGIGKSRSSCRLS